MDSRKYATSEQPKDGRSELYMESKIPYSITRLETGRKQIKFDTLKKFTNTYWGQYTLKYLPKVTRGIGRFHKETLKENFFI